MNKFLIEAIVEIRVENISGLWKKTIGYIVNAPNLNSAKTKFEDKVKADLSNMEAKKFTFEYTMAYPEI